MLIKVLNSIRTKYIAQEFYHKNDQPEARIIRRCSDKRDSRRAVTSVIERGARGGERGMERNSFHSLPLGAIEAGAMLGSHRERNPSRSENWHRRMTIYIPLLLLPLLPRHIPSLSFSLFLFLLRFSSPRIPRNSAAGDWRWRPRALRDKLHQHTPARTNAPTNPHEYTSSSSRPRNFRRYGREAWAGGGGVA